MIIDLKRFINKEKKYWTELGGTLDKLEEDPGFKMNIDETKRFYFLYQRTSADLAKLITFSAEQELRRYLESLVARTYGEIHETRESHRSLSPVKWFFHT